MAQNQAKVVAVNWWNMPPGDARDAARAESEPKLFAAPTIRAGPRPGEIETIEGGLFFRGEVYPPGRLGRMLIESGCPPLAAGCKVDGLKVTGPHGTRVRFSKDAAWCRITYLDLAARENALHTHKETNVRPTEKQSD